MVTTTRTDQKMVTGKINDREITVPAGTVILEAARMGGIEIPNLCFQPMLRAWGSCRVCVVKVLGKRGGLIESCATPFTEGMEVLTHSPESEASRQFLLQMYLIDHALDCPTCDKSGECYLQDNTYLHNVTGNPYRRPKLAQPYTHFSELIDYKWDRCIMCNRCTRVCDEMIGVTAIETTARSLEASISPAFGADLTETKCTNCGMCIAVCPVGAMTDRHFGHHPWELDSHETICGFCDVGCTINVETNRGVARRTTHLWERGVNHGYTCEFGRWGHEQVQHQDRLFYPTFRERSATNLGFGYQVAWDDAIDAVAESLAHYQGDQFAALVSPDVTNEEAYLLSQFTRAVMASRNVGLHLTPSQLKVRDAVIAGLGTDVANTNNMQELFTDVKAGLLVGPSIGFTEPVASYWFYHSAFYREAKYVVISQDDFPLCHRAPLWLKPNPGTTATLLNGIARQLVDLGLVRDGVDAAALASSLAAFGLDDVAAATGLDADHIRQAAVWYGTGGAGLAKQAPDGGYGPALIYNTAAHAEPGGVDGDPAAITAACINLAILTGNFERPGGGVATPRGPANYQGAVDMGADPHILADADTRALLEAAWLPRWTGLATTRNGFLPVQSLPSGEGLSLQELIPAISDGRVKAMVVQNPVRGRRADINPELAAVLPKLEYLVVLDSYDDTPLGRVADAVLPLAMAMEKDGTMTGFDRTVQRLRAATPPMGEALSGTEIVSRIASRMGYHLPNRHPSQIMTEISQVVPVYRGITYARLERGGMVVPMLGGAESPILGPATITPTLTPAGAPR